MKFVKLFILYSFFVQGTYGGQTAAIKIVYDDFDVENEVNILKMLNHPNIVQFFGYEKDDFGFEYKLAFELCECTLHEQIQNSSNGLKSTQFGVFLKDIVAAFNYIDGINVAHFDVKSKNILWSNGSYKLCDFGGSAVIQSNERSKAIGGTFMYAHPAVLVALHPHKIKSNEIAVTKIPRSIDLWSIGITIYESATKRFAFNCHGIQEMYDLLSKKPQHAISGRYIEGVRSYEYAMPDCNLKKTVKDDIESLLAKLLEVIFAILMYLI